MKYDVIIIGAGPGGIFAAYELMKKKQEYKIAVFEEGYTLKKRKCPIDGDKIKNCINCKHCSICHVNLSKAGLSYLAEQVHSQMENTISQMISVEHCMNISVSRKLLI